MSDDKRPPVMRVDCAWCGTVMRPGSEPRSHGICPTCYEKQTGEAWKPEQGD